MAKRSKSSNLIIYEPAGAALEYSRLALNHYIGCTFRCSYCFGPNVTFKSREVFHAAAVPRGDLLAKVGKAAKFYTGTDKRVLLSFIADPYPDCDAAPAWTRQVLQVLKRRDVPWQVLTKAGAMAQRDLDLFTPGRDAFAVTLTTMHEQRAAATEPGAARPSERVENLAAAKALGIETWVSIEPIEDNYRTMTDALAVIKAAGPHTDLFKIGLRDSGRHFKEVEPQNWRAFMYRAANLCGVHGSRYYFKKSLMRYWDRLEFDFPVINTDNRRVSWRATK